MKIISLRFANLNSLPGPYHIRFDAAPLADTGLFAITGPTGAGKSTLLDAIAVGLYGRVPRHDRQVGEMVSRHAPGAWSEVEFEVHETNSDTGQSARVRYRARWEVRRKTRGEDKGGLNQDAMTLAACATGQTLLSGKELVPARVSELSGLDFGQFEQAVLLSQGKFARFLHAPEKERSALLEKMTNVGIYSQLGTAAFEKAKAEEQQTKLLEATLQATRLLPPAERERLETQLDALHAEAEMVYEHQQELNFHLAWRIGLDGLEKQLTDATREATALAAAAERLQPDFERLAGHERADTLRPALVALAAAQRELAHDAEALASLGQQLPTLALAAEVATATLAQATEATAAAATEAERLRPVLQAAQRHDAALAATHAQLERARTAHAAQARQLAADGTAGEQLAAELADLGRQHQALARWLNDHHHERDLAAALQEIKRDLLELEANNRELTRHETTQGQLLTQRKAAATERQRHQHAADEAARHQQALHQQGQPTHHERAALLADAQPADLGRAATGLLARLHLIQRLLPLARAARQHRQHAATLAAEHETEEAALLPATQALADLEAQRRTGQQLLDSLERERRLHQALADLNAHRHQLRPGEACPLCGALEHVYAADFAADADEPEQRVVAQKAALATLEHALRQAEQALVRRRTEQQQRLARRHEATQAAADAQHQAAALAAGLAPAPPPEPEALEQLLAETTVAHEAAAARHDRLTTLDAELAALRAHQETARDQAQAATDRATLAGHQLHQHERDLASLKHTLAELREQAANYRAEIQGKLLPYQLPLPAAAPYDGLLATLAERADTYGRQANALAATQQAQGQQLAAQRAHAQALTQAEAAHRQAATDLAREQTAYEADQASRLARYAGPDPAAAEQALYAAAQQLAQAQRAAESAQVTRQQAFTAATERLAQHQADHTRHQADHDARHAELAAALAAAGFESAAAAQALLLAPAEAQALAARRQQHRTSQQASAQLQARLATDLTHYQEAAPTALATAALTAELTQLNTENERLHQRLGGLASQLAHDDEAQQLLAAGRQQLAARQREQQRWHDLAEQIGSARGDKFSQFAQGLTLSHLARLANLRLRQLTGRYTILKTPSRNLELQIIDHDQADTVRPMASLSGGESFLVSLALALGLSELAGYKARIESLFIDEGFGTLDPDALNTALDALERLQHSGKMIGVISHVADLKERIGTQIRVQPVAGGNSTVRVVDVAGNELECPG